MISCRSSRGNPKFKELGCRGQESEGMVGRKSWIKVGRLNEEEASCGRCCCGRLFTPLPPNTSPAPPAPAFHLYPRPSYLGHQQPSWKATVVFRCLSHWYLEDSYIWRKRELWCSRILRRTCSSCNRFFAPFLTEAQLCKFAPFALLYVKLYYWGHVSVVVVEKTRSNRNQVVEKTPLDSHMVKSTWPGYG